MPVKGVYNASDIIKGEVTLEMSPPFIIIKTRKLEEIIESLDIAAEKGYIVRTSFTSPNGNVRLILERKGTW